MLQAARAKILKKAIARASDARLPSWRAYGIAISAIAILFFISIGFDGESEVLVSLIYVLVAVAVGVFLGRGPATVAGVLSALSVDYHYIRPTGAVLDSWGALAFLAASLFVIEFIVSIMSMLQSALADASAAKQSALHAAKAREDILAVVAHDLRQPLSAIGMRSSLLQRMKLEQAAENAGKHIAGIRQDLARANRMIEDLLNLGQIDSGQLVAHLEVIDLPEQLKRVADSFAMVHPKTLIRFESPERVIANADPDRFQQVMVNLIGNAIKYGVPDSEVLVRVTERGPLAEVEIRNYGAGISSEHLTRIFDRFARTQDAKSSSVPGLGLGLFITKNLVEIQGGHIWAESVPGKTTSFLFTLKLASERVAFARGVV